MKPSSASKTKRVALHPKSGPASPRTGKTLQKSEKTEAEDQVPPTMYDEEFEDAPLNQGLLTHKRKSIRDSLRYFDTAQRRNEWKRPYWLGSSLFLLLFAFWILDSLKDPLFARLVDGKIEKHQPIAKLCSVASTLALVCLLEYLANLRQRKNMAMEAVTPDEEILDASSAWKSMPMYEGAHPQHHHQHSLRKGSRRLQQPNMDDTVSVEIFYLIGLPYVVAFGLIAFLVYQFELIEAELAKARDESWDVWYVLAYLLYATVESFGSILVATFWSYTNSTLSLDDAERYYGHIIALAQLGAIGGSTLVATDHWNVPALIIVVSLVILLHLLVMRSYDRLFEPTSLLAENSSSRRRRSQADDEASILTWQDNDATLTKPFWSGIYLIFSHYYVMLILGVSCLYEVALTCLDYQMKLLGYSRFEQNAGDYVGMSFAEFMGRYGQVVNFVSLLFSSLLFPFLIQRFGLRITLRLFPTLLLIVTFIAFGALPGNLTVLFLSLSILKAMTYSVHDPSKEILYIPTSNAVKFRAKFWIDVVGERISKAVGSAFNTASGSLEASVKIGGVPSLLSAAGLWIACFYVGIEFDRLLRTGTIVGLEHGVDPATYKQVSTQQEAGNGEDNTDNLGSSLEISFSEDADDDLSTLGMQTHDEPDTSMESLSSRITPKAAIAKIFRV